MLEHLELIIFGLLVAVAGLVQLSRVFEVPYPVFLVLGGLALGLIPGLPKIELPPNLVFLIFLPPLLYSAAFYFSPREFKVYIRPIALLGLGLVPLTAVAVAVAAHVVTGLSWSAAFVLGVIVSPTDSVAATAIASLLPVPRRIAAILEGESLINDGVALVLYRTAVAATVAGSFSVFEAGLDFVLSSIGGVAIGLLVGWAIARVRGWTEDPLVEITISLFTAYAAYIPAEDLGVSGVLAVVAAGIYLGWHSPVMIAPRTRLQAGSVWEVVPFLLNSVLFILVGLQLPLVVGSLSGEYSMASVILYGALVSLAVIVTRLLWVFPQAYLPRRFLPRRLRELDPYPPWQHVVLIGYTGMRGAVSLAAALSLPLTIESGAPFPGRDLILFLTLCVIVLTMVPQGLSLPFIIRRLGLAGDVAEEEREEIEARRLVAEAALARIEELMEEDRVHEETAERMRHLYELRRRRFAARLAGQSEKGEEHGDNYEELWQAYQRVGRDLLAAEREELLRLRNQGRLSEEARRRIERDLDLEDARLEI